MKKTVLFTLALCLSESVFSQNDFRKGYIITNAKDTVFGLVNYLESAKVYKTCSYKKQEAAETVNYEATDITGYGFVNDKFFASMEDKNQPATLAFYEVIVKGSMSLYRLKDTYYVNKNGSTLEPLTNESKEVTIGEVKVLKESNQHIITMNMLMKDCGMLRQKIQKLKLKERPMTALVEDYNKCVGAPSITYKAARPWVKTVFGFTAGVSVSTLHFESGDPAYDYLAKSFDPSVLPMLGISFDLIAPRINERVSFHGDLLYTSAKYKGFQEVENSLTVDRNYSTIELQEIKIPMGFRYTFPEKKITPYFNLGMSTTLNVGIHSTLNKETEFIASHSITKTQKDGLTDIRGYQLGYWGGIGLTKSMNKKIKAFIEVRVEQTNGLSKYASSQIGQLNSRLLNLQVMVGIRRR